MSSHIASVLISSGPKMLKMNDTRRRGNERTTRYVKGQMLLKERGSNVQRRFWMTYRWGDEIVQASS
jgi:hypothetical protein